MSPRTVAPVVVKPDIASKKASVYVGQVPERRNGKAPTAAAVIHPRVTMMKDSLTVGSLLVEKPFFIKTPRPMAIAALIRND